MPSASAFVVDTPGRPRVKAAPVAEKQATVGDRTLALIFDRALLASILMILAAWQTSTSGRIDPTGVMSLGSIAGITFLLMLLYHVILEGAFGTTLGKAMMALRVRSTGDRGRFVAVVIRNVFRVVDAIGLYLIGFLFAMFTQRGQLIGDLVGGTVVMEGRGSAMFRAGMMVLWLVLVGAAIFTAWSICPDCRVVVPR
ncbi:MAG: RDD family protein [Thermoanaerobaculia bacterium]